MAKVVDKGSYCDVVNEHGNVIAKVRLKDKAEQIAELFNIHERVKEQRDELLWFVKDALKYYKSIPQESVGQETIKAYEKAIAKVEGGAE